MDRLSMRESRRVDYRSQSGEEKIMRKDLAMEILFENLLFLTIDLNTLKSHGDLAPNGLILTKLKTTDWTCRTRFFFDTSLAMGYLRVLVYLLASVTWSFVLCKGKAPARARFKPVEEGQTVYVRGVRCNFSSQHVFPNFSCFPKSYSRTVSTFNVIATPRKPVNFMTVS